MFRLKSEKKRGADLVDSNCVPGNTNRVDPDSTLRKLPDELEGNRRSHRTAWATLQRLRKFLEENGDVLFVSARLS